MKKYIIILFIGLNFLGFAQSTNNKSIHSSALSGFQNLLSTMLNEKGDSTIVCNAPSQKYIILFYCNGGFSQHRRLFSGKSYDFSNIKRDDRSVILSFKGANDTLKDSEFWFAVSDSGKFEKITVGKNPSRFFVDSNAADILKDHKIKQIDLSDNTPVLPCDFGDLGEIRISSYSNSKYIVIDRILILQQGNETDNGQVYSYYLEKFE